MIIKNLLLPLFILLCFTNTYSQGIHLERLVEAIPIHFTKVSKDSAGLLIYKPCDGSIPKVDIEDNYIILQGQLESDRLRITNFKKIRKNKYKLICVDQHNDCPDKSERMNVYIKLVNRNSNIWSITANFIGFSFFMVPDNIAEQMRKVDNPSPDNKILEKTFLEIKY